MPFEFLSDEHIARYNEFRIEPTAEELAQHFRLSTEERALILDQYEPHNRLGMAIQLVTLKYKGTFLTYPTAVPKVVVRFMAEQLAISDTRILRKYLGRKQTKLDHTRAIRDHLKYKDFNNLEAFHLRRFLYAKLLVADERPIELFDLCTRELVTRRVVLPGATILARLIVGVRERVSRRLYRGLAQRLTEAQKRTLGDLLIPPTGERKTLFDRLRTPPTRTSAPALLAALERFEAIRAVGVGDISLQDVPESRLDSLSKYAEVAWAGQLAKLNRERCYATLLAYVQHLEKSASDDALRVFDALMSSLGLKSQRKWRKERLRSLRDLDSSALLLRDAVRVLLDPRVPDVEVRKTVLARFSEVTLRKADTDISELTSPEGEEEAQAWQNASNTVGKFILKLLTTLKFEATPGGQPLLTAMHWLAQTGRKANNGPRQPDA